MVHAARVVIFFALGFGWGSTRPLRRCERELALLLRLRARVATAKSTVEEAEIVPRRGWGPLWFTPAALLDGGGTAHASKGCRDVPVMAQNTHFYIPADNHMDSSNGPVARRRVVHVADDLIKGHIATCLAN